MDFTLYLSKNNLTDLITALNNTSR